MGTNQVLGGDWLPAFAGGHHHVGQALAHVRQAAGQGQHCHYLTGHGDVKLGLVNGEDENQRDVY